MDAGSVDPLVLRPRTFDGLVAAVGRERGAGGDADAGGLEADQGGAFVVDREPDVDAVAGVDRDAVRGEGVAQGSATGVVDAAGVGDGLDRRCCR